ncbi:hypothetical protein [Rhodoferax sp.]|uniref:hypothetical protein n=1 Tax=Rhodoferax sp. TaxID=50421 RepID=UPI001EBBEB1B|nr:hypothetical protein [Rhodoferax sp.]MBT9507911.1 hypothetical protein [Rhodoferax sp.]
MIRKIAFLSFSLALAPSFAQPAADPAEVDAVVASIKASNPDLKSLCQKGPEGIRKASTEAVTSLMSSGKVKGNPQATGGEAGQKVGRECRGG